MRSLSRAGLSNANEDIVGVNGVDKLQLQVVDWQLLALLFDGEQGTSGKGVVFFKGILLPVRDFIVLGGDSLKTLHEGACCWVRIGVVPVLAHFLGHLLDDVPALLLLDFLALDCLLLGIQSSTLESALGILHKLHWLQVNPAFRRLILQEGWLSVIDFYLGVILIANASVLVLRRRVVLVNQWLIQSSMSMVLQPRQFPQLWRCQPLRLLLLTVALATPRVVVVDLYSSQLAILPLPLLFKPFPLLPQLQNIILRQFLLID